MAVKNIIPLACFIVIALIIGACTSSTPTPPPPVVLPNTPETVARQWQQYVDENKFEAAKVLSAPNASEWLQWVSETLTEEMLEEDTLAPVKILGMTCVENTNRAACAYSFDDNGLIYQDTFVLLQVAGQWLVDIPKEALIESDDMIEAMIKEKQEQEQLRLEQ